MHFNQWVKTLFLSGAVVSTAHAADPKAAPYQVADSKTYMKLESAFKVALTTDNITLLENFYDVTLQAQADQPVSVLRSKPELGWGVVSIDHSAKSSMLLQVPHRYFDTYTADIAEHWLNTGRFKLAIVNTVHRYGGKNREPAVNSDFSTAPNSAFIAATQAFITTYKQPLILQLHGYSKANRRTFEGQQADVILSHGANLPMPYLTKLTKAAECISSEMSYQVKVFPKGVAELGGTKNVIGRELRKLGHFQQFIHIELSKEVRIALRKDRPLAELLLNCIAGPAK